MWEKIAGGMAEWGGALIGETAIKENEREWEKKMQTAFLSRGRHKKNCSQTH